MQGKSMLVIGTISEMGFLDSLGITDAFSVTYRVPKLNREDAKKVKNVLLLVSDGTFCILYLCTNG